MMRTLDMIWAAGFSLVAILGTTPSLGDEAVPQAVIDRETRRIEAIGRASSCTVSVFGPGGRGGGSGVVITSDGYALTNFHVTKPCGNHMKCSLPDNRLYDAVIVGIDPTGDVALIKLLGRDDFPVAEMGDSDQVQVGDWCFAVGNPFLLATDFQPTVSFGIVSGVHRYQYPAGTLLEYADCLQTDAAINPGNSGGPLFNAGGQLIGINGRGSFEKRGRVNVGVGYAISINQIKNFMGYLRSGRIVDHATLGATVSTDQEDGRMVVTNMLDTSDAFRRGLRYGDEIVEFGGRAIRSANEFKNVLGIYPKGWRVPLSYVRDGQRKQIVVRLAGVHGEEELIRKVMGQPRKPASPRPKQKDPKPKPGDPQPPGKPVPKAPLPKTPLPKTPLPKTPLPKTPLPKTPLPKTPLPKAPVRKPPPKRVTPPHVAKLLKARTGYANYYFNELNRQRIWQAFEAHGAFGDVAGDWVLEAQLENGEKAVLRLGAKQSTMQLPAAQVTVDEGSDLAEQLGPDGSGGLLATLHLWRRMLALGPLKFGDVYYLGTTPLVGRTELCDVLVATHDVVESHFQFDPKSGHLVGIEMFSGDDADSCEVRFSDYHDIGGRQLPQRLVVKHGDQIFAEIRLQKYDLSAESEKKS